MKTVLKLLAILAVIGGVGGALYFIAPQVISTNGTAGGPGGAGMGEMIEGGDFPPELSQSDGASTTERPQGGEFRGRGGHGGEGGDMSFTSAGGLFKNLGILLAAALGFALLETLWRVVKKGQRKKPITI